MDKYIAPAPAGIAALAPVDESSCLRLPWSPHQHQWIIPSCQRQLLSRTPGRSPASLLMCSRHEDGSALEEETGYARATLSAGMCFLLHSGEWLLSSLPTGEVLLVVNLSTYSTVALLQHCPYRSRFLFGRLLSEHGHRLQALSNEAGGDDETVLFVAGSCVDAHPRDQSVDFAELTR